jgi:hypothetical protein
MFYVFTFNTLNRRGFWWFLIECAVAIGRRNVERNFWSVLFGFGSLWIGFVRYFKMAASCEIFKCGGRYWVMEILNPSCNSTDIFEKISILFK